MEAIGTCVRDVLAGFQQEAHDLAELAEYNRSQKS